MTLTASHSVFVRDAQAGDLRCPPLRPVLAGGPCRTLTISADSRLLATAVNGRNMVQVWDLLTGQKVGQELPHPGDMYGLFSVAFSPDGKWILTGHKDGRARIWDWKTGRQVGPPMQHPDEVWDARFTPTGRHILCGVRYHTLHVWDVATNKLAIPLPASLVQPEKSDDPRALFVNRVASLAVAGDRVVVPALDYYSVLNLSLLLEQPADPVPLLQARAELATNQKQQLGELVPLEQQEWMERWEQLVSARQTPEAAAESLARALDQAQSDVATQIGGRTRGEISDHLAKVVISRELARLTQEIEGNPLADARRYFERATFLARLGRWSESTSDLEHCVKLSPADRLQWAHLCARRLYSGDREGYLRDCQRMREAFQGTTAVTVADSVCKANLLIPDAVDISELPTKLLSDEVSNPRFPQFRGWFQATNGLISVRQRKPAEAIGLLRQITVSLPQAKALVLVIRSIAEHQLGQTEQAAATLKEAEALIPSELKTLGSPNNDTLVPVSASSVELDWLNAEILRREAAALIVSQTDDDPASDQPATTPSSKGQN